MFERDADNPRRSPWRLYTVTAFKALFYGDRDAPQDREIKARLIPFFQSSWEVKKAYLADIQNPNNFDLQRALCIKAPLGDATTLMEQMGAVLDEVLEADEDLDIIQIDDQQDTIISRVCTPFYERREPRLFPASPPKK